MWFLMEETTGSQFQKIANRFFTPNKFISINSGILLRVTLLTSFKIFCKRAIMSVEIRKGARWVIYYVENLAPLQKQKEGRYLLCSKTISWQTLSTTVSGIAFYLRLQQLSRVYLYGFEVCDFTDTIHLFSNAKQEQEDLVNQQLSELPHVLTHSVKVYKAMTKKRVIEYYTFLSVL